MKITVLFAVFMAVCMVLLPMLWGGKMEYQPSVMEQNQQMEVVNVLENQEPKEAIEKPKNEKQRSWKAFRILDRSSGEVKEVPVLDYVMGAVCSEMPATFHIEALKAQAVSAHTWALYCQQSAEKSGQEYDFSADPSKWQGYVTEQQAKERFGDFFAEYWGKVKRATQEVWQEILVDQSNAPIVAAYHAISSGRTESAENVWGNAQSCLVPVESQGDIHAPGYQKTASFSAEELKQKLMQSENAPTLSENPGEWLSVLERSGSGYVTLIRVGSEQMSGIEFRELLGLRSSDFDITFQDGTFLFTTLGYGHGVGLSQYGADYLARQGKNYREILEHYYSGAKVVQRES